MQLKAIWRRGLGDCAERRWGACRIMWRRALTLLLASALWPQSVPAFTPTRSGRMRLRSARRMATTSRYEPGIVSTSIDSSGEVGNATSSLSMGSRLPASLSTVGKGDSKLQAQLLEESYVRSGEITKIFSKTFYLDRGARARCVCARALSPAASLFHTALSALSRLLRAWRAVSCRTRSARPCGPSTCGAAGRTTSSTRPSRCSRAPRG